MQHELSDHLPSPSLQYVSFSTQRQRWLRLNRALDRLEVGDLLKNRGLGDDSLRNDGVFHGCERQHETAGKYLVDEAADGDHSKAGVLELSKLVAAEYTRRAKQLAVLGMKTMNVLHYRRADSSADRLSGSKPRSPGARPPVNMVPCSRSE